MIPWGWVLLYVVFLAVAAWILAWCRRGMEEVGRDTRLLLIAQAKAEEDGMDARPAP